MRATMSILGLYNWDGSLFDGFSVPEAIDRATLTKTILAECAELEVIYPNPALFKSMVEVWSKTQLPNWQRMVDALLKEYDPLHNYDRTEVWNDTSSSTASGEQKAKSGVAGFNQAAGFADSTEDDASQKTSAQASSSRTGRTYGNIGVTTSQQMLESEIMLRGRYNAYDIIVNDFKQRFCLLVY